MTLARVGVALLLCVALTTPSLHVSADQYTDQISADQQQKAQDAQQIAALRAQIAAAQNQEAALQKIIAGLDTQIADTQKQVNQAQALLNSINTALATAQAQLAEARVQLAAQKRHLAQELVVIYEMQQQSTPLSNLLSSGDFNSFWTNLINSRRISNQELQTAAQIHRQQDLIQVDVTQIGVRQQQQQATLAQLFTTQQQLAGERSAQQAAVNYLTQLQAQDVQRENAITAAENQLDAEIATLQAEEAAALAAGGGSGRFAWPENAPISQGFGCTPFYFEPYDASCPYPHRFHNGLDIAGPCGNEIRAADSGIANIEPYQTYGLGNNILIAHGNGWSSVYGHLSGFAVGSGQQVTRGQVIGYEGSTGNSTGCHLHFSINHNGNWVNPLDYLS